MMNIEISTDRARLDLDLIHGFLTTSYWAEGIPRETVARSIEGSLCFGAYTGGSQIGFARVITDYATFAYVADVFVVESYRGAGCGKLLIRAVMEHPDLQGLRRWSLVTRDAHELYRQFGFQKLSNPEGYMEILRRDIYSQKRPGNQDKPSK